MPVFIGDYLADTMHLSTEQHGAYLLLLFHLWRRGLLPDDDGILGQITGLDKSAWSRTRPTLAEFFEIRDGLWHHRRVERERIRVAAKQQVNIKNAKLGASRRWSKQATAVDGTDDATQMPNGIANGIANANGIAKAMRNDADSHSESESEISKRLFPEDKVPEKRSVDPRHTPFRAMLAEYWSEKNHASPEMPWQGRDARALGEFLAASPKLSETQFRQMLGNRARSAVAHGDRVYLWIGNLTRFQEEITLYNKPASAGGGYASRAEINRNSVVSAVDRALQLAREHADRTGQAGVEPAAFDDAGMSPADGAGPDGCSLATAGNGDHGMAAGHAADGEAGTDGPVSYRAATAAASEADRAGRQEVTAR